MPGNANRHDSVRLKALQPRRAQRHMLAMQRRSLLLVPLLLLPTILPAQAQVHAAALSAQDQADVARVEAYLNSI